MKSKNLLTLAVTILLSFTAMSLFAQTPPSGGGTGGTGGAGAPIDGGAIALLIGVASIGYKNLRDRAKANN